MIPHEKELVERLKDEPFALVGINTDNDKEEYFAQAEEFGVNWRSSWQGGLDGPIPTKWGVNGYPTLFLICLLYTSPSPRDQRGSRMPSSA